MAITEGFAVERTIPVEVFVPAAPRHLQDRTRVQGIFDSVPLEEVRKRCMEELGDPLDEHIPWFVKRIHAYLKITDYATVLMLVRALVPATNEWNCAKICGVVLDVFEHAFDRTVRAYRDELQKEITVVLCGLLARHSKAYDERAKKLIQKVLGLRDSSSWGLRIFLRLVNIVGVLGDSTLLPDIEQHILPMEGRYHDLKSQFEYFSVTEERRDVDAHARQVAAFLKHLASKQSAHSSA